MPEWEVTEVLGTVEKPDRGYGPMQEISMSVLGPDGERPVRWYTKASTSLPMIGSKLSGDVVQGKYGLEFKKERNPLGGAPRPEDPKRAARILRQHSQDSGTREKPAYGNVEGRH